MLTTRQSRWPVSGISPVMDKHQSGSRDTSGRHDDDAPYVLLFCVLLHSRRAQVIWYKRTVVDFYRLSRRRGCTDRGDHVRTHHSFGREVSVTPGRPGTRTNPFRKINNQAFAGNLRLPQQARSKKSSKNASSRNCQQCGGQDNKWAKTTQTT